MSAARAEDIRARIEAALQPAALEVLDEGHLHAGHAGEGQGHFRVRVTSAAFEGLLPIRRHRLVYDAVGELMGAGIHALAIEASTPAEAASKHHS